MCGWPIRLRPRSGLYVLTGPVECWVVDGHRRRATSGICSKGWSAFRSWWYRAGSPSRRCSPVRKRSGGISGSAGPTADGGRSSADCSKLQGQRFSGILPTSWSWYRENSARRSRRRTWRMPLAGLCGRLSRWRTACGRWGHLRPSAGEEGLFSTSETEAHGRIPSPGSWPSAITARCLLKVRLWCTESHTLTQRPGILRGDRVTSEGAGLQDQEVGTLLEYWLISTGRSDAPGLDGGLGDGEPAGQGVDTAGTRVWMRRQEDRGCRHMTTLPGMPTRTSAGLFRFRLRTGIPLVC